jgi:hypothetical protein
MFQIVSDKWYFTVVRRKCGERFAFLDAPSPEKEIAGGGLQIPQNPDSLGCPMCGHQALYQPDEVNVTINSRAIYGTRQSACGWSCLTAG